MGKACPGRAKGQYKGTEMRVVCTGGRGWGWPSMGDWGPSTGWAWAGPLKDFGFYHGPKM